MIPVMSIMAVSSTAVLGEISTQQPTSWFDTFLAEGGGILTWQGGWGVDIVDDDEDNGRGGGTTRRRRTMAKEDEDGGQGGVLGSVEEGRETQRCWMPLWQEGGSF